MNPMVKHFFFLSMLVSLNSTMMFSFGFIHYHQNPVFANPFQNQRLLQSASHQTGKSKQLYSDSSKSLRAKFSPTEVDEVKIDVIVDNASDNLADIPSGFGTTQIGREVEDKSGTFDPDNICSGIHGLSLLIEAKKDGKSHTVLFDTGPSEKIFESNTKKMKTDFTKIETIVISHYHYDHTGGLLSSIRNSGTNGVTVDLHPSKPLSRGSLKNGNFIVHPTTGPEFEQIRNIDGAKLELHSEPHLILDNFFFVSGNISRTNNFEKGASAHYSKFSSEGEYERDPGINEERYLALKVKGRGLVVCSACSHAGIINIINDAKDNTGTSEIAFVTGGFHLAGENNDAKIVRTVNELKKINPQLIATGHCTGWRAQALFGVEMKEGQYTPSIAGHSFLISSR
mmetsp:Transcript_4603/g.5996  ORF Transcript_4603/g.5996 Transcript_4603/m.5996 type:complete len:398 (-) Transcript_4603:148-1341(-)